MKLSSLSIKRPVTFFMIFIIAVGFGIFGFSRLKLDLFPEIEFPMAVVVTNYEGVGPEDIENTLTRTLENTLTSVEGVKHINSVSQNGVSLVQIEFNWGIDMDQAETDIRRRVDLVRGFLPEDADDPLTFVFNPSMMAIMRLKVSSEELGNAELRRLVEDQIQPRLERIEGVASASVSGGLERQIQVNINPYELAANNISILEVVSLLASANLPVPGGLIEEGMREFSVVTNSEFESLDDIENTIVGYSSYGEPLYLKNIADVVDDYKEVTSVVRDNRQNSINISIQKQSDANTVQVCNATRAALREIEKNVGGNVKLYIHFDQSEFIKESASNLATTGALAFLLTGLVLLLFLRHFRSSLIAAVSVPVSIVITFFVMSLLDVTLNIISMAGMAIAIGMLVDNSIVVLENIFRRHDDLGEVISVAADKGASEVGTAVMASTLTTLSIFIPMLFVEGVAGMLVKDLALTIVASLTISLFVSLSLVPLLSSKLLNFQKQKHKTKFMVGFDRGMESFFTKLGFHYRNALNWSLKHKKLLVFSVLGLFAVSIFLLGRVGFEFMPKTDDNQLDFNIELPVGTALPTTDAYFRQIENIIVENVPEMENMNVNFGRSGGLGAMFGGSNNSGRVSVTLIDKSKRNRSKFEIQDQLRQKIAAIPGIKIVFSSGGLMGFGSDMVLEIYGHDLDQGQAIAEEIRDKIDNIPGIVDIELSFSDPQPEYSIIVDREKAGKMGLNIAQIARIVETAVKGATASVYRESGEEYEVYVQLDREYRESEQDLKNIFIKTAAGQQIPLSTIAHLEQSESPVSIERKDQNRVVTISANVSGRDLGFVVDLVEKEIETITLPPDFRIQITGSAEDMQQTNRSFMLAILAAVLLVYMVMASQFESLLDPFIILFTIPLALIGVAISLFITGTTLNITSLIGAMVLVGIVVNNGIVLIDYINRLIREEKQHVTESILDGAQTRLRPVLMTALTTILSMIPLALEMGSGAELWGPMARTIIGGLIASTFLTLFFVPILFDFLQHKRMEQKLRKSSSDSIPKK